MNAISLVHSHEGPSALLEREDLAQALGIVIGAAERRNTIPILSNVLLARTPDIERCITATATNLDIQIAVNVRANVSEDFATTVPAHTLLNILRKIPESDRNRLALEMLAAPAERRPIVGNDGEPETDEDGKVIYEDVRRNSFVSDRLQVRLGRATFEMNSLPVGDFPEMAPFETDPVELSIAGTAFWNALDAVKDAMSEEETRYYLNGIYLHVVGPDVLAATATDGHRLFRQEIRGVRKIKNMPPIILPAAAVNLMHTLMKGKSCPPTVDLFVSDKKFAANWGPVSLITKTIDGTYPDYARVIPTNNDKVAVVNAGRLVQAIGAVTAVASERGRAVKCLFEPGKLTLTVNNLDSGRGVIEIDCQFEHEPLEIGFNAESLAEILGRACPGKGGSVTIRLADAGSPTLFTGSLAGWTGVAMPMRI